MMMAVDWIPLVSTVAGAAIAISGTVMADQLRRRDNRHRYSYAERQRAYSEMVLALGAGLEGLRGVAAAEIPAEKLAGAASGALSKAGLYPAREKILMTASAKVALAAEMTFDTLIAIREAVLAGAATHSREFHDAYHPYSERMWQLRMAIRTDLGAPYLNPDDLHRKDASSRERCTVCNPQVKVS
jgi:hypothetical protein